MPTACCILTTECQNWTTAQEQSCRVVFSALCWWLSIFLSRRVWNDFVLSVSLFITVNVLFYICILWQGVFLSTVYNPGHNTHTPIELLAAHVCAYDEYMCIAHFSSWQMYCTALWCPPLGLHGKKMSFQMLKPYDASVNLNWKGTREKLQTRVPI